MHHALQFSRTCPGLVNCKAWCNVVKWWVIIIYNGDISQHGEITKQQHQCQHHNLWKVRYNKTCTYVPYLGTYLGTYRGTNALH